MPVAVQQAQQRPSGFDQNLDRIAKGLQIATSLFNIPISVMDRNRKIEQEENQAKIAAEDREAQGEARGIQNALNTQTLEEKKAAALRAPEDWNLTKQEREANIAFKQAQTAKAKREATMVAKQPKLTVGQEALDRDFAKTYNEFISSGGYTDVQKGLDQLKQVQAKLGETDMATGPIVGLIPKKARDILTPAGAAIQDSVEEVVQRNLRLVLGAQFTAQEGERLIDRAYNPRLSEEENNIRVGRLIKQIEQAAQAKQAASQFFEKNGTLAGYSGIIPSKEMFNPDRLFAEDKKGNAREKSGNQFVQDLANSALRPPSPTAGTKPKTITQGGYTYKLNEKTGEYE